MVVTQPASGASPDASDIQGNLVGFNKDHARLVFIHFRDAASGKAFLQALVPDVATASDILLFNQLYKQLHARGAASGTIEATWMNVALSVSGLTAVGAPNLDTMPGEFTNGMAEQAGALGDVDDSDPSKWVPPFNPGAPIVHAMVILAADSPDDLEAGYGRLQATIAATHVTELDGHHDGNTRPGAEAGHEHFGFKDGVSQPGIEGLTTSSKTGTDTIAAGEFLIGYPYGWERERPRTARSTAAAERARLPPAHAADAGSPGLDAQRFVPRLPPAAPGRRRLQRLHLRAGAATADGPGAARREARWPLARRSAHGERAGASQRSRPIGERPVAGDARGAE